MESRQHDHRVADVRWVLAPPRVAPRGTVANVCTNRYCGDGVARARPSVPAIGVSSLPSPRLPTSCACEVLARPFGGCMEGGVSQGGLACPCDQSRSKPSFAPLENCNFVHSVRNFKTAVLDGCRCRLFRTGTTRLDCALLYFLTPSKLP